LEEKFSKLPPDAARVTPVRSEKDILEEILELVREQSRYVTRQEDLLEMQQRARYENEKRHIDEGRRFEELKVLLTARDRERPILAGESISLRAIKKAVCAAIAFANERNVLQALENGKWSREEDTVIVETNLSKAMVGLVITPSVIQIAVKAIEELGETLQFRIVGSPATTERDASRSTL
jgi:hypothetical protein